MDKLNPVLTNFYNLTEEWNIYVLSGEKECMAFCRLTSLISGLNILNWTNRYKLEENREKVQSNIKLCISMTDHNLCLFCILVHWWVHFSNTSFNLKTQENYPTYPD